MRAVLVLASSCLAVALAAGGGAKASVPSGTPVFSNPATITNVFAPFVPGAVKVFSGRDEGARVTVVDLYRTETRTFVLGGSAVQCRIVQETEFEDGGLVEISQNYFAQSDDGSVWYFGEVVDDYEDGVVVSHGGSWLVGGPSAGDPAETFSVAAPALFMPADPEAGDVYRPEDVPDGPQEVDTVEKTGRTVRTPAGKFTDAIQVGELSLPDSRETKWWAPGVGVVQARGRGELLRLDSSTLRQP